MFCTAPVEFNQTGAFLFAYLINISVSMYSSIIYILEGIKQTMKNKTKKLKTIKLPKISWKWNSKKGERFFEKPTIDSTDIRINGKIFTCILLSIASGFIDLTFFSGLSKSLFHVGTVPLPAAVLYTIISIGFILGKFWCATELSVISELQTRLNEYGQTKSAKKLFKPKLKWQFGHKFLVFISIVTALSLSVNSIGAGMRNIEQTIKNMSNDANELIELNNSVKQGVLDKRSSQKSNITGTISAQETAKSEADRYVTRLKSYQEQYFQIQDNPDLTDEEKLTQGKAIINRIVNEIPGATSKNAIYFTEGDLRKSIQKTTTSNETIDVSAIYEEGIAYDNQQIEDKIRALAEKEYKDPDGTLISFLDENGKTINIQTAISRLQSSINKWQAPDAGDAGESSKIFTLIATYLKADSTAGGMGVSEWMMLIFIAIAGIVQEFLIALYTPKSTIDRKTLSQFSAYIDFKSMDVNEFLIFIYTNYLHDGSYNQEKYNYKMEKVIDLIAKTKANWIDNEINKKVEYYTSLYNGNTTVLPKKSKVQHKLVEEKPVVPERVITQPEPVKTEIKNDSTATPVEPRIVSNTTNVSPIHEPVEFSSAVDDLVNEIDEIV